MSVVMVDKVRKIAQNLNAHKKYYEPLVELPALPGYVKKLFSIESSKKQTLL